MEEELVSPKAMERIRQIISNLPEENGWRNFQSFRLYQGFWCFPYFLKGIVFAQERFNAQPSDIIVSSAPKSGTTWIKALTFAIVNRPHFGKSANLLLFKNPHECLPSFEMLWNKSNVHEPGIPLIATHTPYASLPKSVHDSDCKIVYLCREPKDTFVSLFHFEAKRRPKENEPFSIEEALELFCEGKSIFGPFWDHILGYWKASLERPDKVMFLKYEDLLKDSVFYVKKLAEFMGYPFSMEEEEAGAVERIVNLCSFENLSNLEVNKTGGHQFDTFQASNKDLFRKGKVGDWRNYLTPQMANRLDNVIEQKLKGSGLTFNCSN